MQIGSIIAIYFVVWWLCLFMVLPWGARSQSDAGEVTPGTEPGAPALFRIWRKLLITSVLAALLSVLLVWALGNPTLREYWR
ncbi:hypothetical protein GCM10007989_00980 [Devosia pacifica]|uniref:DUF1467 domain-containing protein n=1 Tax=Devosia pacifica TaxID=1335967 RepID=A0A918VNG7_9HYPH|nr:DUF1467 family protein [Devosia pacifica]GHA10602.1 hypothetical protein GCM10007989_00980 [Devosia pacifica]